GGGVEDDNRPAKVGCGGNVGAGSGGVALTRGKDGSLVSFAENAANAIRPAITVVSARTARIPRIT
ncbi:MAG TPA: hypothetical protein VJB57_15730, partial [Dehalococcoidia bacterium]|nr:hypothetical protein [Dehalococcoidia bacterium]